MSIDDDFNDYKQQDIYAKILKEINHILSIQENIDENCNSIPLGLNPDYISIYDVYKVIVENTNKLKKLKKDVEINIKNKIFQHYGNDAWVRLSDGIVFTEDSEHELPIAFSRYKLGTGWDKITFTKRNGDLHLHLKRTNSAYAGEVFKILGEIISNSYDSFMEFKGSQTQYTYGIKSINCNFIVDITKYGVQLYDTYDFWHNFRLEILNFKNKYDCDCNSYSIISTIKDKEQEIFKKVFVNIEDCPKWMRKTLYEIRKNQIDERLKEKERQKLIEEQKKEEQLKLEEKKQKRLNFKRKALSLFKK